MTAPLLLAVVASCLARGIDASIPRSSHSHFALTENSPPGHPHRPAWNPSPKINPQGYLCDLYRRIPGEWEEECPHAADGAEGLDVPVVVRQVPGDGDCLFHAVAISLSLVQGGRHSRMDSNESLWELKDASRKLRQMAVECLRACNTGKPPKSNRRDEGRSRRRYRRLFIQGCETMATADLLSTAAAQYGITGVEYCDLMEQDSYWGGGPEIVVLCNILKRPIHVYELVGAQENMGTDGARERWCVHNNIQVPAHLFNNEFCLRRMATFGSPKYDSKEPLHILSADSRFPDVRSHCITANGNHFMAVFPVDAMRKWVKCNRESKKFDSERKRRVRGGAADAAEHCDDQSVQMEGSEDSWLLHGEWFNDLTYSNHLQGESWLEELDQLPRHRRMLRLRRRELPGIERKQVVSLHRHPMKRIVGFWFNVLLWTLSHFRIAGL